MTKRIPNDQYEVIAQKKGMMGSFENAFAAAAWASFFADATSPISATLHRKSLAFEVEACLPVLPRTSDSTAQAAWTFKDGHRRARRGRRACSATNASGS